MFLNIITPCSRPENLHIISRTINIPRSNFRWIVVFDSDELPQVDLIPDICEVYLHRNSLSCAGHAQRNYALDLIVHGHVYNQDDDTLLHPELWDNIKDFDVDFISFDQLNKDNSIRLTGDIIEVDKVDSHNFIVKKDILENTRFVIDKYNADGILAVECYNKSTTRLYINKPLSTYNSLRNED